MNQEFQQLNDAIDDLLRHFNAAAIAIDGMTGAGKTELAALLSRRYGAPIIHMSDFVLPVAQRRAGWEAVPGGDQDFDRFNEEVADPWMKKKPIVYTVCDPETGEPKERAALPDARLYIIEGTYVLHPAIRDFYDLRIFMKVPPEVQAARLAGAESAPTADQLFLENQYFLTYMTEMFSDLVLDDDFRWETDPADPGETDGRSTEDPPRSDPDPLA